MTELLYLKDNYIREFDARITKISPEKYAVTLDRTAFYPEGGGQVSDRGEIHIGTETFAIKIVKREGSEIWHYLDKTPKSIASLSGKQVHGAVNWENRHAIMRFHTAQHVFSRVMQVDYKADTVGNQVKIPQSRIDFSPYRLESEEERKKIETKVNDIFAKELPVSISFKQRDEAITFLKHKGYQYAYLEMVPKSVKEFRIISVGDFDYSACAGTHVANTREIGVFNITKTESKGANKTRFYYSLGDSP